jgi:predicted CoA-binding protein
MDDLSGGADIDLKPFDMSLAMIIAPSHSIPVLRQLIVSQKFNPFRIAYIVAVIQELGFTVTAINPLAQTLLDGSACLTDLDHAFEGIVCISENAHRSYFAC